MKRRDLLKAASMTFGTLAVSPLLARADDVPAEMWSEVDVLVVGGGPAGTVAALQAARAGAKTALVEMGSQLGGVTTTGGVSSIALFYAWGKQVIGGIGWELVRQTVEMHGNPLPDFTKPASHWRHSVQVKGQLYAALIEEACLNAGISLAYYQFPLGVEATANGWLVDVVGKGVRYQVKCKQLIDCTGGADIVGLLGFERLREDTIQPGTLIFNLSGYNPANLDAEEVQRRYLKALEGGELEEGDHAYGVRAPFINFLRARGGNQQHIHGADSSTAVTKTQANIAGRRSLLRLLRFIRSLPGCENAQVHTMMQETGVRETYRIVGETTITYDDYTSGRLFDDAVCYSFFPIDLHNATGVKLEPLRDGIVPTVPLGALIPKGSCNLLVAGRSVSSDRLANSALRVQASCMAMGQAAGATAALAVQQGGTTKDVALADIRILLQKHAAIVPT